MSTFKVALTREDGFWVAVVDDVTGGATEARTLAGLAVEVEDLLAGLLDLDESDIQLEWDLSALGDARDQIDQLRATSRELTMVRLRYDDLQRTTLRTLADSGISVRDSATLTGLSHQRVSQVLRSETLKVSQTVSVPAVEDDSKVGRRPFTLTASAALPQDEIPSTTGE